ncbi:hypothetical protein ABS71_15160 [bacterium SCN 62-11]|nr:MAG: hypothetical protein ABS71_15160 [bacterium SCN 62-11]
MGVVTIWSITVVAMAATAQASLGAACRTNESIQAMYIAETGVATADLALRDDHSYAGESKKIGDVSYVSKVYQAPGPAPNGAVIPANCVYVLSSGTSGGSVRTVGALLRLGAAAKPIQGGYVVDKLSLTAASWIDSYSSTEGLYSLRTAHDNGDVVTNSVNPGSIQLLLASRIAGTAFVGPKGQLSGPTANFTSTLNTPDVAWMDPTSTIDAQQSQVTPLQVPAVVVPDLGGSRGDISRVLPGVTTLDPGTYGSVSTAALGQVRLNPGTYVFDSLNVLAGSIVTNGPVKIYIKTRAQVGVGGLANTTLKPSNMILILADGANSTVAGGSQAAAVIYGPKADINIVGGNDIYGAVIGKTVSVLAGSRLHFDEDLKTLKFDPSNGASKGGVLVMQRF